LPLSLPDFSHHLGLKKDQPLFVKVSATYVGHPAHEANVGLPVGRRGHLDRQIILANESVVMEEVFVIIAGARISSLLGVQTYKDSLPHAIHAQLDQALHPVRPPSPSFLTGHVHPATLG